MSATAEACVSARLGIRMRRRSPRAADCIGMVPLASRRAYVDPLAGRSRAVLQASSGSVVNRLGGMLSPQERREHVLRDSACLLVARESMTPGFAQHGRV